MERLQPQNQVVSPSTSKPMVLDKTYTSQIMVLKHTYTYSTRGGDKQVEKATMFDVNKTIMRCLVKNLAMFGLGLYIYAGEVLPEGV